MILLLFILRIVILIKINFSKVGNLMVLYTKRGLFHKEKGEASGDIVRCLDNGEYAVITLADGASVCKHSTEGADIISSRAIEVINDLYGQLHFLPEKWAEMLLDNLVKCLSDFSKQQGISYIEYSTTLMILLIERNNKMLHYCNIGDGLLLGVEDKKCPIICMPQGDEMGCPMVTTEGVERIIDVGKIMLDHINHVLICTDGTWRLMYENNMLKPEVKEKLISGKFEDFKKIISTSPSSDDCSFAIIDVRKEQE